MEAKNLTMASAIILNGAAKGIVFNTGKDTVPHCLPSAAHHELLTRAAHHELLTRAAHTDDLYNHGARDELQNEKN